MFTWISKGARAAPLMLAACVLAQGGARVVQLGSPAAPGLAVAAPAGYCAARDALARLGQSDFVAFVGCGAGPAKAVLTATVGPPGSAQGADLSAPTVAAFATSDAGRAAISRAGRAGSVTIHEVVPGEGAVLVRLTDLSNRPPGLGPGQSWRAVFAAGDRLVTLAATGADQTALPEADGRRLIGAFVRSFRAGNATGT